MRANVRRNVPLHKAYSIGLKKNGNKSFNRGKKGCSLRYFIVELM